MQQLTQLFLRAKVLSARRLIYHVTTSTWKRTNTSTPCITITIIIVLKTHYKSVGPCSNFVRENVIRQKERLRIVVLCKEIRDKKASNDRATFFSVEV